VDPAEKAEAVEGVEATAPRQRPSNFMKISGQDYLRVADRVVWFREEHPDGVIHTELLEHEIGKYAVFKATVVNSNQGSATGYGSETFGDFKDYLEKAEAKALGRALGNLGYGTASALADDGADHNRVVDAPVSRGGNTSGNLVTGKGQGNPANANLNNPDRPATDKQREFIRNLGRDIQFTEASLNDEIDQVYGGSLANMTAGDASEYINLLQQRKAGGVKYDPGAQSHAAPPADDDSGVSYPQGPSLSKMGWPDIETELGLNFAVGDQVASWKQELTLVGTENTAAETRENIKAMCALAGDAVRLKGPTQAWRFVQLINAIPIEHADTIDSVVRVANEKAGLAGNKQIQDAAAGRIHTN
jgi:hypothetical protein